MMGIKKPLAIKKSSYEDLDISIIDFAEHRRNLPDYLLKRAKSKSCQLTYIKEGRIIYYIDYSSFILETGDFIFIPEGTYRRAYHDNKSCLHCYIMELDYSFNKDEPIDLLSPTIFNISKNIIIDGLYEDMSRIWIEKSKGYRLMSRAIALQIFHEIIFRTYHNGVKERENNRIEIIKDYVYDNCDREISVEEIADFLNLNPNYLGSYFKKKTGYTLRQYANCVRVNKAKSLLSTGKYSVSVVAEHCGYQDIYYFSKVFKEIEGVPPSAFIK